MCVPLQTRDPQLHLALDLHSDVFSVSASGIRRYLTLLQPLDREAQDSYTFTVVRSCRVCVHCVCAEGNKVWLHLNWLSSVIREEVDIEVNKQRCTGEDVRKRR